jgi:hypothetical protein
MPKKLELPAAKLPHPELDSRQLIIVEKLTQYIELKKQKNPEVGDPTFTLVNGLCAGLVAYWLYCKRVGNEKLFLEKLEYALNWDAEKFSQQWADTDPKLEEFINVIAFLNFDYVLRDGVRQDNLGKSLQLILSEFFPQVTEPEFRITCAFNKQSLAQLIKDTVHHNKMVRVGNGRHAVGLMYSDGLYHFLDGGLGIPASFATCEEVAEAMFACLSRNITKEGYIPLYLCVFDLYEEYIAEYSSVNDYIIEEKPEYPDPLQYCQNLLKDPAYQAATLNSHQLFRIAARYGDYAMLDLLFERGYKYGLVSGLSYGDVYDAVSYQDEQKVRYLIEHGVPVDYRGEDGTTALGRAIELNFSDMMVLLLAEGADPNFEPKKGMTNLDLALKNMNAEAIIILLASGLELSNKNIEAFYAKFEPNPEHLEEIIQHAIQLNKKLLKLPEILKLETATGDQLIAFIEHAQMLAQFLEPLDAICLQLDGEIYSGYAAIEMLNAYYKTSTRVDLLDVNLRAELYGLLKYFISQTVEFDNLKDFDKYCKKIAKLITKKDIKDHSAEDLLAIEVIMDTLEDLSDHKSDDKNHKKMKLSFKADEELREIKFYLKQNNITSIEDYIAKLDPETYKARHLLFTPRRDESKAQPVTYASIKPYLTI